MIESERNFSQKKMKVFTGYSTVGIKPIFGITPEPLDTIYVRSSLGSSSFLSYHDMISSNSKRTIGMPVIGIVQAAGFCMFSHQLDNLFPLATLNWKYFYFAVALKDSQNNCFTCCSQPRLLSMVIEKCTTLGGLLNLQ